MHLNIYKNSVTSPKVSFIIPTLNSGKILKTCLQSIKKQSMTDYEIIISDGGSTDETLKIAKKYHCRIVNNRLKTAEAGKAVGLKQARGTFVALIDSDNILPSTYWLKKMLLPFSDSDIIGSEPIKFTYRKKAGYIERYSALIGANDPYAWFMGVHDRYSYLSNHWTGLKIDQIDKGQYLKVSFQPHQQLPTIGANGTIFRGDFIKKNFSGDYFFDIDILSSLNTPFSVAKVKIGIIHTYCESSINKFIRKQNRRLTDMFSYLKIRQYNWQQKIDFFSLFKSNLRFALYSILIFPSLYDSLRGFIKKPDYAWFFHSIACLSSLIIYTKVSIQYLQGNLKAINRSKWQQ